MLTSRMTGAGQGLDSSRLFHHDGPITPVRRVAHEEGTRKSMSSATERAVQRLERALRQLEAAVERRVADPAGAEDLAAEVHMLSADRARLAETLDQSQARAGRLETVNRDVSRRVGAAMEVIQSVLHEAPDER